MKKSIIKSLGVLALLGSSVGNAATVTVTPSASIVNPGDTFYVDVSVSDMPGIGGFAMKINFNSAAVAILTPTIGTGITGIPTCAGCTWTFLGNSPFVSGGEAQGLAGFDPAPTPSGSFGVFRVNFQVLANAPANSLANIVFSDGEAGWTDAETFEVVPNVIYQNAQVVVPVPAAAWLFMSAVGGLAALRRRLV